MEILEDSMCVPLEVLKKMCALDLLEYYKIMIVLYSNRVVLQQNIQQTTICLHCVCRQEMWIITPKEVCSIRAS